MIRTQGILEISIAISLSSCEGVAIEGRFGIIGQGHQIEDNNAVSMITALEFDSPQTRARVVQRGLQLELHTSGLSFSSPE
jgi:hypothetical protein